MPKYLQSNGEMIDKKAIDRKVSKAKKDYVQRFIDEHDYYFCERTKRSDLSLDCSHIISVRMCQATGRSELAWCSHNLELLSRDSHNDIETWPNDKRERWYFARKEKISLTEFLETQSLTNTKIEEMARLQLVFDIETVRQFELWNDVPEDHKAAWKYVSNSKYPTLPHDESYTKCAALYPEFSKVVCISTLSSKSKTLKSFDGMEFGGTNAEFTLLKNFKDMLEQGEWKGAELIGHYIKGFDIPFLTTRYAANKIAIPTVFRFFGKKPWEITGITDTREIWTQSQFKSCQAASLVAVCLALNVPTPKDGISGADVGKVYYSEGKDGLKRIVEYCEKDVKANALVFNEMVKYRMIGG